MTSKPGAGHRATGRVREAYIYIQLPGTVQTVPAALLRVQTLPDGTQIGRFRYGDRYLQRPEAVALDPFQLPLTETVFEFTERKGIPGAVRDASPDAWGRRVIEHRLERSAADLQEIDYLLHGPQDGAGHLSFGLGTDPPAPRRPYNRTHQLAELVAAAQAIDEGRVVAAHLLEKLEPGTSLGGARPKATIEDAQTLWLGKFAAQGDRFNLQRVEFATLDLARRCGLHVTQAKLQAVGGGDVLLLQRFDRAHSDDLVPAPVVSLERRDLALTVGDYGRTASVYNLLSQAGRFGLSLDEARTAIEWLVEVVRHWRDSFCACGVSAQDIAHIAPAMLPACFFFEERPGA